jgi:hypothetical protein
MSRSIDVSDLADALVEAIEMMVQTYRQKANESSAGIPDPRPIRWLKGKWELPDSFFDPLPDDLLDLFEVKGE